MNEQMNQNAGMNLQSSVGYYSSANEQTPYYNYYPTTSKKGTAVKVIGIVLLVVFSLIGIIAAIGITSSADGYSRGYTTGYAMAIALICILYGLFMFGMLYGIGMVIDNTNATNQKLDQMNHK